MAGRLKRVFILILICNLISGCGGSKSAQTIAVQGEKDTIVIGFSQVGAESDWRNANTESMKETFTPENGYQLIFEDGQQKQANQIKAIRTFIQKDVDYIVLAPVTETGWDTVLQEAKDADIPVIIVDRMVDVADESLFTCWVGSDFELEGKKIAEWLHQYTVSKRIAPEDIHIVNIQGTIGASAQIGRTESLAYAARENGWDLLEEAPADYTRAKGREVMNKFLAKYKNINVVYCENDNEALGAIDALEAAGKTIGSDIKNGEIMLLSFDGVNKEALQYVLDDKITCIAECNPLHGPRVKALIEQLEIGITPEKLSYVEEEVYCSNDIIKEIQVDGTTYQMKTLTPEDLGVEETTETEESVNQQ